MPDNPAIAYKTTADAGETLITPATDDIAGVQYPRFKPAIGADGTAADVHAGNPMPVVDGAVGTTADAESTTGAGTLIAVAKRLRTLLAGGLPAALTGGGNLKTAILEALPAGTNDIGRTHTASLTNTETTTALLANAAFTGATRSNSGYSRFVVQAFADQAGTLNIQQSDGAEGWRTVATKAVAANAVTVLEATCSGFDSRVTYTNGATAQTAFQLISRLISTGSPPGASSGGGGGGSTSTETSDGVALPSKAYLIAGSDGTNAQFIKTDVDGNAQVEVLNAPDVSVVNTPAVTVSGAVNPATGQGKTLKFASISTDGTVGDKTIVAAVAANKIKVVSYVLVADGAVTARWYSGAVGTALSGAMSLAANGGVSAIGQPSSHLLETAVNTALVLNLGGAVGVRGHISYFEEG